ncbi:MAG: hydrogenase maturation protease [Bacteroidetes bacterium]|nr:hydrogenase maturation protease [Bacteroidota bacterium]
MDRCKDRENQILIMGIGNEHLTDDGIGPKLVGDLQRKSYPIPLKFQTAFLGGLEIVEMIDGYKKVIFIDAIRTKDGIPGSIYHFSPSDFKETLHLSNLHDASFLLALQLGKKIGVKIPEDIDIIAIEIIEDLYFSTSLTRELEDKYPQILEDVDKLLTELIACKSET